MMRNSSSVFFLSLSWINHLLFFPFGHVSLSVIILSNINAVVILPHRLAAGDLSVQVNLNDYLDIYCPYYPNKGSVGNGQPETLALYLVAEASFQGCVETRRSIKRWECNTPFAPFGPVRFSEKIQRFTPFSLGFEFLPGRHYYYSSLPTDEGPPLPCMKLRVTVCCEPKTAPSNSVCSLRTASPPLLLLLLFVLLLLIT
ncbi:Ephrin-A4%2C partial [Xyrichtys novacula]|uniref:Ephrin-A4, partial n=1 Tax=Xyrichtys novacula TaxID=13765 RepID=A0AAV1FM54_XYRNO|nr:Ephrin-A4%2C partial [Xyrichtys novacula]